MDTQVWGEGNISVNDVLKNPKKYKRPICKKEEEHIKEALSCAYMRPNFPPVYNLNSTVNARNPNTFGFRTINFWPNSRMFGIPTVPEI